MAVSGGTGVLRRHLKGIVAVSLAALLAACSNSNTNNQTTQDLSGDAGFSLAGVNAPVPSQNPLGGISNGVAPGNSVGTNYANLITPPSASGNIISNQTKFSSSTFGVEGSPRVATGKEVRKGGGRYHVGKPYTIRGIRYVPKEDPDYTSVGLASWYGPNFHGRLTANGEVYDQFALSAAHPTMPLPSYAKVTNLENGSSVMVRVNDRGPFSKSRVIDLSAKAAHLLGYTKKGVAKVKVEYVGKAQMDGLDYNQLLASYDPGTLPMPSGATIIAATAPVVVAPAANAVPQPSARKTLSQIPQPVSVSGLQPSEPLSLVSGYQTEAQSNSASAAIDAMLDQSMQVPTDGMASLTQLSFPVQTMREINALVDRLSDFGPVSVLTGEAGYTVVASVPSEDIAKVRASLTR